MTNQIRRANHLLQLPARPSRVGRSRDGLGVIAVSVVGVKGSAAVISSRQRHPKNVLPPCVIIPGTCTTDIDRNGDTGINDFLTLLGGWGACR